MIHSSIYCWPVQLLALASGLMSCFFCDIQVRLRKSNEDFRLFATGLIVHTPVQGVAVVFVNYHQVQHRASKRRRRWEQEVVLQAVLKVWLNVGPCYCKMLFSRVQCFCSTETVFRFKRESKKRQLGTGNLCLLIICLANIAFWVWTWTAWRTWRLLWSVFFKRLSFFSNKSKTH